MLVNERKLCRWHPAEITWPPLQRPPFPAVFTGSLFGFPPSRSSEAAVAAPVAAYLTGAAAPAQRALSKKQTRGAADAAVGEGGGAAVSRCDPPQQRLPAVSMMWDAGGLIKLWFTVNKNLIANVWFFVAVKSVAWLSEYSPLTARHGCFLWRR